MNILDSFVSGKKLHAKGIGSTGRLLQERGGEWRMANP